MRTVAPVKHLKRYRDRHGKLRLYHRPTNTPISSAYGTAEFFQEMAELNKKSALRAVRPKGTLSVIMAEYRKAPAYTGLAPSTRFGYDKYFALVKPFHDIPARDIDSGIIAEIRDGLSEKHGRRTANYALAVLSVLFGFAVERKYVSANPVKQVRRVRRSKKAPKANRPWEPDECRTVIERAPLQIKVPLALCMLTGMRKRDALTITPAAFDAGGRLTFETSKTDEVVSVMPHPMLIGILRERGNAKRGTISTTVDGGAWTSSGFDTMWIRFRKTLEDEGAVRPGLTIHGLRHTVGGMLADAGCDPDTIRRVLGQKTLHMALLYSERAKRTRDTRAAMAGFDPFRLDNFGEIEEKTVDG